MRRQARRGGGRQLEVAIDSIGGRGDGVARAAPESGGRPIFVPGVLPGERVRVRLTGERAGGYKAELLELIALAPERREPPCPHFGPCGGCALQHWADDQYRAWKGGLVRQALARRGFDLAKDDIVDADLLSVPPGSRRRAVLAAERRGGRLSLGFHERESHAVVALTTCQLLRPALVALLEPLRRLADTLLAEREAARLVLTETEGGVDLLWSGPEPDLAGREALAAFAEEQDLARLSWAPSGPGRISEPIVMRRSPVLRFGGVEVTPPAEGFVQPSAEGESAMAKLVGEALPNGVGRVADLYAGCGAFTFAMAAGGRSVHAVEGQAVALEALRAAVNRSALAERITTELRDLAQRPLLTDELEGYDAIVFDPPRAGSREQSAMLASSQVPLVVALSCNPNSFARDARILADGGYRLERVTPIDQFPWSGHLELAAVFRR